MKHCANCGGALGEPGVAYSYAGQWCQCFDRKPADYPNVPGFKETERKLMGELIKAPAGPITVMPPEQTLTPMAFIFWLRGYAAHGHIDPKILAELQKVKP